jgi:hypothetical protein
VSTSPRHSEQTATRPAPQISEERRQTVETARQSWIRKLIDLSRRNNLLYFRPLKTGTLELTSAPGERLRDLLVGESVSAAKLLPNLEDDLLAKTLRDISRRALENSEEKGLSTLFVTFGMATWPALDGGRPAEAPVLLMPVAISKKEGSNSYYLSAAGSFQLNLVRECGTVYSPLIAPPTFYKDLNNAFLSAIWNRTDVALRKVDHVILCGYSFPDADIHIKYLLKRAQTNRQEPFKVTVINHYKGKKPKEIQPEKERYRRFLGSQLNYTELSFQEFVANPLAVLRPL